MAINLSGGCACGAVRYRLTAQPTETSWCHCSHCRKSSGAPAVPYTTLPREGFILDLGAENLRSVKLTDFAERLFCAKCGSPIATRLDHQPQEIDITVATLDDPEALPPEFHIFTQSEVSWARHADGLSRYARTPRDGGPNQ